MPDYVDPTRSEPSTYPAWPRRNWAMKKLLQMSEQHTIQTDSGQVIVILMIRRALLRIPRGSLDSGFNTHAPVALESLFT